MRTWQIESEQIRTTARHVAKLTYRLDITPSLIQNLPVPNWFRRYVGVGVGRHAVPLVRLGQSGRRVVLRRMRQGPGTMLLPLRCRPQAIGPLL